MHLSSVPSRPIHWRTGPVTGPQSAALVAVLLILTINSLADYIKAREKPRQRLVVTRAKGVKCPVPSDSPSSINRAHIHFY